MIFTAYGQSPVTRTASGTSQMLVPAYTSDLIETGSAADNAVEHGNDTDNIVEGGND